MSIGQLKSRNQIQYVLVGSVPTGNLKFLLHRLGGLCEEAALIDKYFEDHESVFVMKVLYNTTNLFSNIYVNIFFDLKANFRSLED